MSLKLRYALALLFAWLTFQSYGQQIYRLGYCDDELSDKAKAVTLDNSADRQFQIAVLMPSARMQALKGGTVTKIRVYTTDGIESLAVWLRNGIDQTAIKGTLTRPGGTSTEGWTEVTLKTPYVITGEDLVIGYSGTMPAGKGIVFDGGQANANSCLMNIANTGWFDASSYGYGSHCLQAVVELTGDVATDDLALSELTKAADFAKIGEPAALTFYVNNYGTEDAAMPKVFYSLAGAKAVEIPAEGTLKKGESKALTVNVPTDACTEGNNSLKLWLESDNTFKGNDTLVTTLACYQTSYPRKTLIENFTTLSCVNCPYGHATLNALLNGRNDYIWVAHHVGYGTDELTNLTSNQVANLLGVSAAPLASFDRRILGCCENANYPAFGIGYSNANYGADALKPFFEQCVTTPAFVSVQIEQTYHAATRELSVTVSGEKNGLLDLYYPGSCLTVELIENGVQTKGIQTGSGETIHSHVFREALSPVLGEEIAWDGNKYSKTYTFTVPEEWNADRLYTVAFVNRPASGKGTNAHVLNAIDLKVEEGTTGIDDATDGAGAKVLDRAYYNLNGQRIAKPKKGVFIEEITTDKGKITRKTIH